MPLKHNAARRHRIPARYPVTNWPAYEAGLRRRGDLTFWVDDASLAGWRASRRTTPGGQPRYSDRAIELVLTLRLVVHLALRQAEAFAASMMRLLGREFAVPDHTTLSRRGRAFANRHPRVVRHDGPVHLVLDSTGLQLFGQGDWNAEKHGRARRHWRKLHLAVDASTGEIAAHVLTADNADDGIQAACPCSNRSAGRSRDRRRGSEPHDPYRQADFRPSEVMDSAKGNLRISSGPCTSAVVVPNALGWR